MSVVTTLVAPAALSFSETCTLGIAAPDSFVTVPERDPPAACAFARTGKRLRETHSVHAANGTSISLQPFRRGFGDNLFQRLPGFVPALVNGILPSTVHISVPKFAMSIYFLLKLYAPSLSHQSYIAMPRLGGNGGFFRHRNDCPGL